MPTTDTVNFSDLLAKAITEPGIISQAYSAFHGYSLGNRLLAWSQCSERKIPIGPIASFHRWKELGRHVTKGQKAIALCMPVTCKRTVETEQGKDDVTFTRFVFRNNWFVLSQTEGAELPRQSLPEWDRALALKSLDVTEIPFEMMDGNCQGYALERKVAVSPVAAYPFKTLFHELAHVVLGHTSEGRMSDDERTPRTLREVEAESVAMLVCAALGLPGMDESRGYIQHWNHSGEAIPEASARKILKTADVILKAGHPQEKETHD